MPLVRYEVRCEHSLANPELYRTAGQDDSEGLLEGVAMAGLVGIVRQLGDLAEFAAEIFHDLHDDIMKLVSRGRDLKARVDRLEVDLPVVEKALLAECSQLKFTSAARSTWRAPLPMDQNLCAQGELPRFVRNFYDDCRGPPRLFLLDKFDEAGRGACIKRYTDPTFFRVSWAASLLSKAERERREREADSLREKSTAAESGGPKIYPRERLSSALFENLEGFTGDFTPELRSRRVFELPTEGVLTPDSPRSPRLLPQVAKGPVLAPLKITAKDIENAKRGRRSFDEDDDEEFFVDALTTMGSDPDSEPGSRTRWEVDNNRFGLEPPEEEEDSLNHSVLKAHVEARRHTPPRRNDDVDDDDEDFARRLAVAGFDTVREWENDDRSELASVDDDNSLAIVALPSGTLPYSPPDNFSDSEHASDNLSDSKLPYTLPENPPDYLSDTLSDKLPYSSSDKPLSDELPYSSSDKPLSDKLPYSSSDKPVSDDLPYSSSDKPLSDKLPYTLSIKPLSDKVPDDPPEPLTTFSDKLPLKEKPSPNKISDKTPKKAVASKRSDKPSDKPPDKTPNKATYQSHESVSLLDSFRPRVKPIVVKPIVASIEARNNNNSNNLKPLDLQVSPVTTPRSRRLWAKDTATVSILQSAELDANRPSEGNSHEGELELELDMEEGYSSSASSSPKGLHALLSPSESPPKVAEGLMRRHTSLFLTNAHFDRKIPRAPPVTPFLADSPSVSRSPSINIKPSPPGNILLRRPEAPADKRKNAPAPSPRRASDNRMLPPEPSRTQYQLSSSLPNPVPRPRTWVDRSDSTVAATLRAIRQAAVVASDDETGSECRSDC